MDAENLVVNQTLDKVEPAPSAQNPAPKNGRSPNLSASMRHTGVEDVESEQYGKPADYVKEAIPERVHLQSGHSVHRYDATEHVVPLKHLMEEDPIKETAQPDAENDARELDGKYLGLGVYVGS